MRPRVERKRADPASSEGARECCPSKGTRTVGTRGLGDWGNQKSVKIQHHPATMQRLILKIKLFIYYRRVRLIDSPFGSGNLNKQATLSNLNNFGFARNTPIVDGKNHIKPWRCYISQFGSFNCQAIARLSKI